MPKPRVEKLEFVSGNVNWGDDGDLSSYGASFTIVVDGISYLGYVEWNLSPWDDYDVTWENGKPKEWEYLEKVLDHAFFGSVALGVVCTPVDIQGAVDKVANEIDDEEQEND